jgi:lantibiotic biosynthesis protein
VSPVGSERFRSAGLALAEGLAAQAVWHEGRCTFHGATAPQSLRHPPRWRSVGGDVYEGSAGCARFLGRAAAAGAGEGVRRCAHGAIAHALQRVEGWSLFSGAMGSGLVAIELADTADDPGLRAAGLGLVGRASERALADGSPYDLLSGLAGVVLGLLAVATRDPAGPWLERAQRMGERLLGAAVEEAAPGEDGAPLSWPLARDEPMRLCGLAHGAAGVALAFEALARQVLGSDWARAARRARAFERLHYSPLHGSWADLRPAEGGDSEAAAGEPSRPHLWCHGSVGIGAERLLARMLDPLTRSDAYAALAGAKLHAQVLLAGPRGPGAGDALNASLCHGLAGLIDLFIDAWRWSGDSSWMALAEALGDLMIDDARRQEGWRCGVPGGWAAPGLLLGHAGIGWALLRLADPEGVPSGWRLLGIGEGSTA